MSSLEPVVYKEGMLLKRQRGLHTSNTRKLKFQERFCCLTSTSLDYYDPLPKKRADGPKGQFAVDKMKIVEPMALNIFGKDYPYAVQIGDLSEIMYFVTDSETSRDEWLDAFKLAAKDSNVVMLSHHHHGVYGLLNKGRWSCCANQRRDFAGCSTTAGSTRKDLTMTLPSLSSSSGQKNANSSSSLPRNAEPPKSAPIRSTTIQPDFVPPTVRRFTMADPLMKPNPQRLNKLRQSVDFDSVLDKQSELEELEEEVSQKLISDKDDDRRTINGKGSRDTTVSSDSVSGDSVTRDSGKVMNGNVRSGASSPSPSVDSGRGTSAGNSRPNSQIEDNRIWRSESVGKKPTQSVILEQVSPSKEDRTNTLTKQQQVEDSDDSSKTVTPDQVTPVRKYQSNTSATETQKDKEKTEGVDEVDGVLRRPVSRASSSPPPYDPTAIRYLTPDNSSTGSQRPLSMSSFSSELIENLQGSTYGSGSDVSAAETPQHRRIKEKMMGSPKIGERPRSFLVKSFCPVLDEHGAPIYSQLHQACKDGNLQMLDNVLGDNNYQCYSSDLVNLEEQSNEEVPYTPLFIAFINDHLQTMIKLLEHGANPNNVESTQKASVLHWACEKGCLDMVDLLVKYKADVNKRDSQGNTPLMFACKNGHLDIVEFLLQHGAKVDNESANGRTPLHECSEEGLVDIMDVLLRVGRADPTPRDSNNLTPYDIAFNKRQKELMTMLQQVTPEIVRPYSLLHTYTSARAQMITSLSFKGSDTLISGSRDCHARFWDTSDLSQVDSVRLTDTVLDLRVYDHTHLVLGSTSIQIIDIDNLERKRTVADDANDDESLENPPLHLVSFGPKGRLATASAESNMVKLWPYVVTQSSGIVTMPEALFVVGEENQGTGCVHCLTISPTPNCPWLAVGFQPGKMLSPRGNKLVYIYDWESKLLKQIFDAGEGGMEVGVHVAFSPCGRFLAIGCSKNLCIWDPKSGALMQKFTVENNLSISSVSYSPNGTHLAAGLSNGEVQVFETTSSSHIFYLPRQKISPVTAMAYSEDGKRFATGQENGCIQLWEAYGGVVSNSNNKSI